MALETVEDRPSPCRISPTPCDEEEPPRVLNKKEEVLAPLKEEEEEEEEEEGKRLEQVAAATGGCGGLVVAAFVVVVRKRPSSTAIPHRPCRLLCRSMAVCSKGCRRGGGGLVKLLLLERRREMVGAWLVGDWTPLPLVLLSTVVVHEAYEDGTGAIKG